MFGLSPAEHCTSIYVMALVHSAQNAPLQSAVPARRQWGQLLPRPEPHSQCAHCHRTLRSVDLPRHQTACPFFQQFNPSTDNVALSGLVPLVEEPENLHPWGHSPVAADDFGVYRDFPLSTDIGTRAHFCAPQPLAGHVLLHDRLGTTEDAGITPYPVAVQWQRGQSARIGTSSGDSHDKNANVCAPVACVALPDHCAAGSSRPLGGLTDADASEPDRQSPQPAVTDHAVPGPVAGAPTSTPAGAPAPALPEALAHAAPLALPLAESAPMATAPEPAPASDVAPAPAQALEGSVRSVTRCKLEYGERGSSSDRAPQRTAPGVADPGHSPMDEQVAAASRPLTFNAYARPSKTQPGALIETSDAYTRPSKGKALLPDAPDRLLAHGAAASSGRPAALAETSDVYVRPSKTKPLTSTEEGTGAVSGGSGGLYWGPGSQRLFQSSWFPTVGAPLQCEWVDSPTVVPQVVLE